MLIHVVCRNFRRELRKWYKVRTNAMRAHHFVLLGVASSHTPSANHSRSRWPESQNRKCGNTRISSGSRGRISSAGPKALPRRLSATSADATARASPRPRARCIENTPRCLCSASQGWEGCKLAADTAEKRQPQPQSGGTRTVLKSARRRSKGCGLAGLWRGSANEWLLKMNRYYFYNRALITRPRDTTHVWSRSYCPSLTIYKLWDAECRFRRQCSRTRIFIVYMSPQSMRKMLTSRPAWPQ